VPQQVLAAIAAGAAVDVPVVLGTNHDEGVSFVAANLEALSGAEAKAAVIAMFGLLNAPKIIPLCMRRLRALALGVCACSPCALPADNFTDGRMALSQVITDYLFRCPTRRAAQLLSGGAREAATFLYEYAHVLSFNPTDSPVCANVTCHAAELPMVFHAVREGAHTMTPPEQALAATFGELWTSFARQGTPSSDATGAWPAFSEAAGQPQILLQTPQPAVESAADDSVCAVWDAVGYTH
jgi:carboxylesterase type B